MSTEEYIRNLVADWPPLTAHQRDRLRVLLRTDGRPAPTSLPVRQQSVRKAA